MIVGSTFRVAPVFGLTAPTGDDNDSDRFGELPRPLQAGDGAWDIFGGAVVTYQTLQYQVDGQLLYRENGRHDGFARGDETRFDASLQYRIWPRSMKGVPGTPGFVYALLESNLIDRERDDVGSGTDANSGGTQWLLAPGLQYVSRGWIVEGTVQLPVAENPHGDAIQDDSIVRVGFRRNFWFPGQIMGKIGKWLGCSVLCLTAILALLAWVCGAINWNQEPPYSLAHSWGEKGGVPGQLNDPTGIAVTDTEVFVSDARNGRIQVFDHEGQFKRAFGTAGDGVGELGRPMTELSTWQMATVIVSRPSMPEAMLCTSGVDRLP